MQAMLKFGLVLGLTILTLLAFDGWIAAEETAPAPGAPVPYPFAGRNMFFGLALIGPKDDAIVKDLDISWLSLQPHLIWLTIEEAPGQYKWEKLDEEIRRLQGLGLDVTMVINAIGAYGEERKRIFEMIDDGVKSGRFKNTAASFIYLRRREKLSEMFHMYPHGDTLPLFLNFMRAAVERYDGDGVNDMPGLKYEIRNWHFEEEYPMPDWPDVETYLEVLKQVAPVIKAENPNAKIMAPGLAGSFGQLFAFADGFIHDWDAAVWANRKLTRAQIVGFPAFRRQKAEYESILREGGRYFDVFDIHLYEPKETFLEGKIDYLRAKMHEFGYLKPIWVCEGGGPFKNPPGDYSPQGDPYYGWNSYKENAEFVVKLLVLAAGKAVERNHWGLGVGEGSYWQGPWRAMGLTEAGEIKKPSYYTYKILREHVRDFYFARDLSEDQVRLFEFGLPGGKKIFVAWTKEEFPTTADLSAKIGPGEAKISHIVTALDDQHQPIYTPDEIVPTSKVKVGLTPVFIEIIAPPANADL